MGMRGNEESLHVSAEALIERLARRMDGLDLAATERNRLSAACFRQALEHHEAVVQLVRRTLFGSALALLRPLFEHYVRGIWLAKCASAADLLQFQNGTLERPVSAMLAAVEFHEMHDTGLLSEVRKNLSSTMKDFLRGGRLRAARNDARDSIEDSHSEDEAGAAIALAGAIGLLAASEVALLAGRHDIVSALVDEANWLKGVASA